MTADKSLAAVRHRAPICRRLAVILCVLFAGAELRAQEEDPAKDALIVESILRLDSFDLEAKPKTKAAVLRFLKANLGSEQFFQLLERFPIAEADDLLLDLAVAKPAETAGVKAAAQLLKDEGQNPGETGRIGKTIAGEDSARAAALIAALGNVGGKQAVERLTPLVTDTARPLAVRSAAATALCKSKTGEEYLLSLAKDKKLPADLNFTVANLLFASALAEVRTEAAKHLQLPASAGAKPLPPLAELMQMKGEAPHGKAIFNTTATCSKCHTVNGEGKDVGPNLSEIGSKLSKDALLVSILDPSAGISHNFEAYLAVTDDGKAISGILVSQTDDDVVLKDANAIVYTLKKADLEELKKLSTSLMPADLQKLMSAQDLVDVVEYLMTLKKP
jgi:putative heme-binding domain-containing protein